MCNIKRIHRRGKRRACACPRSVRNVPTLARRPTRPGAALRSVSTACGRSRRFDVTAAGRTIKLLNIVDEFTPKSFAIVVGRSIDADKTVTTLEKAVIDRGRAPKFIRCDSGPELTAHALADRCKTSCAGTHYINPSSPGRNA